jgi:hypothetical protein
MPENKVLRRIVKPKREEVTRDQRKMHSEVLQICIPQQISLGWPHQGECEAHAEENYEYIKYFATKNWINKTACRLNCKVKIILKLF